MTISPELLAAYADGELEGETAQAVEAAIAADPDLQAKLAAHRALRARLGAHFAPIGVEPVPDRLTQAVLGGAPASNVIDFPTEARKRQAPAPRPGWMRIALPALAASVLVALVGLNLRTPNGYAGGELAGVLENQRSAEQGSTAPVRVLLSFRDAEGDFCRGFAGKAQSGIACHDARGWRLRKLFGGTAASSAEYRQAGSADAQVMAAIQDMAQGEALDAAAEDAAIRQGWRAAKP